jgi:3',5'-nucleoside bisphosphate phosphatase
MTVDLHIHTTASDGTSTPAEVVATALAASLSAIAITDHDSVDGVAAALSAAEGSPIEVVPGVELSTRGGEIDLHLLGYFIDHTDEALLRRLRYLRDERIARAQAMVDALAAAGFSVTLEGVMHQAGGGAVGRSHIARALVSAGDVDSVQDAFARYIGRHGPYFIEKALMPAEEAIALVHDAGGVAVLAHPGVNRADPIIEQLADAGLDGIEAFHAEHSIGQRQRYSEVGRRLGLVLTGGSDYHGPEAKGGRLGGGNTPDSALEALRSRLKRP